MRNIGCLVVLAVVGIAIFLAGRDYVRRHPQDVPWTTLRLEDPVGRFTASKIASLGDGPRRCRAMLSQAGVPFEAAPARRPSPQCGYEDGIRPGGQSLDYRPSGLVTSCPVAAALHLLETRVVQPAAERHFGRPVAEVIHAGSYSCRRLYGREEGGFSEHATADAVDITGFRLEGGREVSVLQDWTGNDAEAQFLRDVRDNACRLFPTVLSPDYNQAHRDHFHLDVAGRGAGWTVCR